MKHLLHLVLLLGTLILSAADPLISIPRITTPPKLDGKLAPGEWDDAAALSMLGSFNKGKGLLLQQPTFYYAWDDTYLYVAMDSRQSSSNSLIASCTRNDTMGITADDSVEIMLAGAIGQEAFDPDFPTRYIVVNNLGTVWDTNFKPQRNEEHKSWQSGIEFESSTNGTRWIMEARIPLKNISLKPVQPGTQWRMNLSRTFASYQYAVLNPAGALNDCRVGADATFRNDGTVVRLSSAGSLPGAILSVPLELVNKTGKDKTFEISLNAVTRNSEKDEAVEIKSTRKFTVPAGKRIEAVAGNNAKLSWLNQVELTVKDEEGNTILYIPRSVPIPCPSLRFGLAKDLPPVDVHMVFLPSKELLSLKLNASHWLKKVSLESGKFSAKIKVLNDKKEVVKEDEISFAKMANWSASTEKFPEGHYSVEVEAFLAGRKTNEVSDWFEKKIFPWMKEPVVSPDYLPAPYTAVQAKGDTAGIWGRSYKFGSNGLPVSMITQGRDYLTGPSKLLLNGKELKKSSGFRFTQTKDVQADGESVLVSDGVKLSVKSSTEYDGFVLYRVTCEPEKENAKIDSLQVKVPLNDKLIKFYSASGDSQGTNIVAKPVPQGEGKIYDSYNDTRSVVTTPSFASLFWVADHEVCFCYAADSDEGWAIRKDVPSVEAVRKNGTMELTIKLVDRPITLNGPRTMEFAFQTGPTRPLPDKWRGYEDYTNTYAPPLPENIPYVRMQIGGDGFTLHGGSHTLHPGETPEQRENSKKKIDLLSAKMDGRVKVVGYQYWETVTMGFPEVRVFRSEWGLGAETYEHGGAFDSHAWSRKFYGENKKNYYHIHISACPSYINFLAWAYDQALADTNLYGFYDDVGYPHALFRPEFGYGFTDENGEMHMSTGLWLYRERWKLINKINAKHNRTNLTGDSQHIHAHYMPAYGFIGVYAPCEQGFYNPFPEKDAYEFYGSLDNYAAMCPAKQFGQIGTIGLASYRRDYGAYSQDSRTMFMLPALHDQTLGVFGRRDDFTIDNMIQARGLFRAWEEGTEFTGYWASADKVKTDSPDLKISYFTRNGSALFLLGNIGDKEAEFTVTPDMKALGLDPAKVKFTDAESLEPVAFSGSFKVKVPRHDLRMVLCGPDGAFQFPAQEHRLDWKAFLGSKGLVSDFKGIYPDRGAQGFGKFKDMTYVQGAPGGYAHLETTQKLPENFTASAILYGSTLGLRWASGSGFLISLQPDRNKPENDKVNVDMFGGDKSWNGKVTLNRKYQYGYRRAFNAVQVKLLKDKIEILLSSDARTWKTVKTFDRTEKFAGAPEAIITGFNGQAKGANSFRRNVMNYFSPGSDRPTFVLFGNLTVVEEK